MLRKLAFSQDMSDMDRQDLTCFLSSGKLKTARPAAGAQWPSCLAGFAGGASARRARSLAAEGSPGAGGAVRFAHLLGKAAEA